jgi:LmbE family N-acetylglucosaminyl deacetylase
VRPVSERKACASELVAAPAVSPDRSAARIAAIHDEIRSMGEAALKPKPAPTWSSYLFADIAPFAIIKRRAARFRLPRVLKSELIDRFIRASATDATPLTTMIVVAHPDDESIGAGARLRSLGDVYVVDVTNGAPKDIECAHRHGFATVDEYAEARRAELFKAIAAAGVPEDRLILLDISDGEASLRLAELCLRITQLIDDHRPQVIVTHPYEGGHTDHDATAFAVHLACGVLRREGQRPPAILELASYHAVDGKKVVQRFLPHERADRDQRVIHLSRAERELKERIFACFESQKDVIGRFSTKLERFRPAPRYVFTEAPHEGQLNYERYGDPDRGKSWREQAVEAMRLLRMRKG